MEWWSRRCHCIYTQPACSESYMHIDCNTANWYCQATSINLHHLWSHVVFESIRNFGLAAMSQGCCCLCSCVSKSINTVLSLYIYIYIYLYIIYIYIYTHTWFDQRMVWSIPNVDGPIHTDLGTQIYCCITRIPQQGLTPIWDGCFGWLDCYYSGELNAKINVFLSVCEQMLSGYLS